MDNKIDEHKHLFNADLNSFNKAFLGHKMSNESAPFHPTMNEELMNDSHDRSAFVCFRGSAKSTLVSVSQTIWRICKHDGQYPLFIIIISQTQQVASAFLQSIKWEIQFNPRIKYYYGELYDPQRTWSKTRIETANNVCVQAAGSLQQIRGFQFMGNRPNIIILDDIESESNSDTPEARRKLKAWLEGAVFPALDSEFGRIQMVGTIIHNDSYLNQTLTNPDWTALNFPIITPDGESAWPSRYPMRKIEIIKERFINAGVGHIFYREFMNEPIDPSQQPFTEEDIVEHGMNLIHAHGISYLVGESDNETFEVRTQIGVDPAISLRGDFSTIVVTAIAPDGVMYVVDYMRDRIRPDELIDRIFNYVDTYHPELVRVEATAFQEVLIDELYKRMRENNVYFGIEPMKPTTKKEARILSMQPKFRAKGIRIKKGMRELKQELLDFPKGATDDLLDGLYYSIKDLYPPASSNVMKKIEEAKNPVKKRPLTHTTGINWLTGAPF